MVKEIKLTQGKTTVVDDEDYEYLSKWKWYYHQGYARTSYFRNKKQCWIRLHQLLFKTRKGVDHINHKKLDNRKCNLRKCNHQQNLCNQKIKENNTSGFKGVFLHKKNKKWTVMIGVDKKLLYKGIYDDKEYAARVYDIWALFYHSDFAVTNKMLGLLN